MHRPPRRAPAHFVGAPAKERVRTVTVTLAVLGAAALATGCSTPPSPPPLSPPIPGDPLDLGAYGPKPCDLLPASTLGRFFVTRPGSVIAGPDGPMCSWMPSDTSGLTYYASIDTTGGGLEGVYARRTQFSAFEPTVVHSYPAVHVEDGVGHCRIEVGVAAGVVLDVVIDARDRKLAAYDDPCTEADTFAGDVIGYQGHRTP